MKAIGTIATLIAPSHWASYLINGDASGLGPDERHACDQWVRHVGLGSPVSCDDYGFASYHDARDFALAADCQTYTFYDPD